MLRRTLQHPNVVSFREVYVTKTDLCIVMEFAEGGELFKRVRSAKAGRKGACGCLVSTRLASGALAGLA